MMWRRQFSLFGGIAAVLLAAPRDADGQGAKVARPCGGYVRQVKDVAVEVVERGDRIEVRLRDGGGAPADAAGSVAMVVDGLAREVALRRHSPGFLYIATPVGRRSESVVVRLRLRDGTTGAVRFPLRSCPVSTQE